MSDTEEMDELRGYVEDGLLSKIQVEILESKLKGAKYTEIEKFYDLSGPVEIHGNWEILRFVWSRRPLPLSIIIIIMKLALSFTLRAPLRLRWMNGIRKWYS